MEMVGADPEIEEGDAPEAEDRQPVGIDRPLRPDRQVVVEHPQEARGHEEGYGVVAVPPLHHRVLNAGECRVALGAGKAHRQGEAVDDVQHGDHDDEGKIIPVGHIDMRLGPARERAQIEHQIGNPDHHQPDVCIPLGLCIFLGLGDTHHVAGDRPDEKQVVADQHEPGAQLIGKPGAAGALHDMERGGNQGIAAKGEDHAGGVHRADPAIAHPGVAEGGVRPDHQGCNPKADPHGKQPPDHGKSDADLGRVVVILLLPARVGLWFFQHTGHGNEQRRAERHCHEPMDCHRALFCRDRHRQTQQRQQYRKDCTQLTFGSGQLCNHWNFLVRQCGPARIRVVLVDLIPVEFKSGRIGVRIGVRRPEPERKSVESGLSINRYLKYLLS